ncbi:MAG: glycosyltransferase family 4 protein [Bacteroidales bacterium]|nr:glycosyltransferase family 4 protein [Bacteroidales bacterium]
MQLLFLPKYTPEGASSRYRTHQFIEHFEAEGYRCAVRPFFGKVHLKRINESRRGLYLGIVTAILKRLGLLFRIRRYDLVFIEKEAIPYFPALFERMLNLLHVSYVLDFDDAVFHNYDQSSRKIIRLLLANKIPGIMKSARHIICGSKYLENYTLKYNQRVSLIPTVVSENRYSRLRKEEDDFIIGWIGSYYTSSSLLLIKEILRDFSSEYPCKIKLIGVNEKVFREFKGMGAERIIWSPETEKEVLPQFDVGIAPLEDTPFNRGKCAFKIIQYMASGSAVICSPIQANGEVVLDGVTGFHASAPETWEISLKRLYLNREELAGMKQKSWERFKASYSLEGVLPVYLEIFKQVCKIS